MHDTLFIAKLKDSGFLPGNVKDTITYAKPTPADKAMFFLDNCITNGFTDDNKNPLFMKLIDVMSKSDNFVLKSVTADIKDKIEKY